MPAEGIMIRETGREDLESTLSLWNDGDVMKFVGFPEGLGETIEHMVKWLAWIERGRPRRNHYSVYADGIGYCGESFYDIDAGHGGAAALDVKLFSRARGRGIASAALLHAIRAAFDNGASCVWVDPNPQNERALALYYRLGFQEREMPPYLKEDALHGAADTVYLEIERGAWLARGGK